MTGTVKWLDAKKGFGFITPADGSAELFAHYSDIAGKGFRSLNAGDAVTFDPGASAKGVKAVNIVVTRHAPVTPQPTDRNRY